MTSPIHKIALVSVAVCWASFLLNGILEATPTPTPGCIDDSWTPASTPDALPGRSFHTAVWTGTEMIVWGGRRPGDYFNTGGRYNPTTDSWTPMTTANAPTARVEHTAVWTGSEMIVWGGSLIDSTGHFSYPTDGGRYNPETDSWTPMSTINAPAVRMSHTAVWTGSEMIVWGGFDGIGGVGHHPIAGGKYNPATDSWTAISTTNEPSVRTGHTAIWTGSEMIVWGGANNSCCSYNDGGRYNPGTDTWTATTLTNAPAYRANHTAVWTGSEMIVWGGDNGFQPLNTGARYNPSTDSWTSTSDTNVPTTRSCHEAIWTGTEMVVWGGVDGIQPAGGTYLNTGGRYNLSTDVWTATNVAGAPTPREFHTAIWTGSEMIVWGGTFISNYLNDGGRYCVQLPPTPTETPTPTPAPTLTPSPTPPVNLSGNVSYCSNSATEPVLNVTLTVSGDITTSTMSDASGNYILSLPSGGSYTITPTKADLPPGSADINTIDVVASQRHFLIIGTPLTGCRLTAADVNGDNGVNTVDVVAIQRFFLIQSTGTANVGKYQFNPPNRTYLSVVSDQPNQNYDTLVFGDVASPFVE